MTKDSMEKQKTEDKNKTDGKPELKGGLANLDTQTIVFICFIMVAVFGGVVGASIGFIFMVGFLYAEKHGMDELTKLWGGSKKKSEGLLGVKRKEAQSWKEELLAQDKNNTEIDMTTKPVEPDKK